MVLQNLCSCFRSDKWRLFAICWANWSVAVLEFWLFVLAEEVEDVVLIVFDCWNIGLWEDVP